MKLKLTHVVPCAAAIGSLALAHCAIGQDVSDPLKPLSLRGSVVDSDTRQPIAGAWLLARESTFVFQQTHSGLGGLPECFRGAFGQTQADGIANIALPATGITAAHEFTRTAYVGWLAYAPRYCVAGEGNFRAGPYPQFPVRTKDSQKAQPDDGSGTYGPAEMLMKKSQDHGEYRILYLTEIATSLGCHFDNWQTDTSDKRHRMVDQIVDEARAEAVSEYDRTLVERLRVLGDAVTRGEPLPTAPVRVVTSARSADQRAEKLQCVTNIVDSVKQQLTPAELAQVCSVTLNRSASPCRPALAAQCAPNARYDNGETALSAEFKGSLSSNDRRDEAELAYIKALLIFGTDPNIAPRPGEPTLLDVILRINSNPQPSTLEWKLRILELLANDGRATIRRAHREQLETPEEKWSPISEANRAFYRRVRELTRQLPLRSEFAPSCELPSREPPAGLGIAVSNPFPAR